MHKKIKIAVIDPVGAKAGMDYYSKNLLAGLANNGVKSYLFSNVESATEDQIEFVSVFALFSDGIVAKVSNLVKGHVKAAWLCKKQNIDVVILHVFATNMGCLIGFLITKLFGLKILAVVHDVESFAGDDNSFARNLIFGKLSQWISVHNERAHRKLLQQLAPSRASRTMYIAEQGAYVSQIDPNVTKEAAREKLELAPSEVYGLFFGQIKKTKGLETLIEAWGIAAPPCKLIIAGKPWKQPFDEYQELIDKNNIESEVIKLIRYIPDSERELLFKAADFVVLPYTEIYQSAVLLMAMSYGLPIIATDIEGFSVILNDAQCGLLFTLNDSEDLGKKITELSGSKTLLSELGQNATTAVSTKYDWDNIGAEHLKNLALAG